MQKNCKKVAKKLQKSCKKVAKILQKNLQNFCRFFAEFLQLHILQKVLHFRPREESVKENFAIFFISFDAAGGPPLRRKNGSRKNPKQSERKP